MKLFGFTLFLYNLVLPLGFLLFIPGLVWKLIFRPGWKKTFGERFAIFSKERRKRLSGSSGGIWFHAVSVGECVVALSLIHRLLEESPGTRIILSTTTTTGQELARKQAPNGVEVIFSPVDFLWTVRSFYKLLKVDTLVIFETEIWPNLIVQARRFGVRTALVNARMSDHSHRGYKKYGFFFGPLLKKLGVIAAQSDADAERFKLVSPEANVVVTGNMKFDQYVPADLEPVDYSPYFGPSSFIIIGASTHPGEEALLIEAFKKLSTAHPELRLAIAPRHAERGSEIAALLSEAGLTFSRRSKEAFAATPVPVLLADTTGELVKLMKGAHIVIMGKSLAGQDEGHNLIEPALLGKPIISGKVLRNFRFVLQVLESEGAIITVDDAGLAPALENLIINVSLREQYGAKALTAILRHRGAIDKTIIQIRKIIG